VDPSGFNRLGGARRQGAPVQSLWGFPLVGGVRSGPTTRTHVRVAGSQRWGSDRGLNSGVPAHAVVDGCGRMGDDRRTVIKPTLLAARRPGQAEPSASALLGAVFLRVCYPGDYAKALAPPVEWRGRYSDPRVDSHRAERKLLAV